MSQELCRKLEKMDSFVLFTYSKLTAQQSYDLRNQLRRKNVRIQLLKNSVAAVAFEKIYGIDLQKSLVGPIVIAHGDSLADVVKALNDWNKKVKLLLIKAGYSEGRLLTEKQIEVVAKLPPKPVLQAMLAGSVQTPIRQVATVVNQPLQKMVYAFKAHLEMLEKKSASS